MALSLNSYRKDGLLHISEMDWKRLETVEETGIKEGDEIEVKLIDVDQKLVNSNFPERFYSLVPRKVNSLLTK